MKRKKNYSLLKHIDFLIIDLICIQICFFCACMVRKDTFLDRVDRYMFMAVALPSIYVLRLGWKEFIRRKMRNTTGEILLFGKEEDIERKIA